MRCKNSWFTGTTEYYNSNLEEYKVSYFELLIPVINISAWNIIL